MTPPTGAHPDEVLAARLLDLGTRLDLGPEPDAPSFGAGVLARIEAVEAERGRPARGRAVGRPRWPAVAAAVVVAILATVAAVAPARDAVADWFGVGAVRLSRTTERFEPGDRSTATSRPPAGPVDLDRVAAGLAFELHVPERAVAGDLLGATADPAGAPVLVELRYEQFTVVEVASRPGAAPVLAKALGPGTEARPVEVGGRPGYWITGDPHRVSSVRPDGSVDEDRVRRAGDVLLWEDGGVTYRVEGLHDLAAARRAAASLRPR